MLANPEHQTVFPFVVGCGRSGTTLLRSMLDSHPDVAIPHESYFVVGLGRKRRKYRTNKGFGWAAFSSDLLESTWFSRWGISDEELRAKFSLRAPEDFSQAVRQVFELYARKRGKSRYGDKTPSYVMNLRLLAKLFPEARFVHIVRDGRDVALSLLDVRFGPNTIDEAALFWREHVARGRRAGRSLGPKRYCEIRYEELVADPESALRALCVFVNVDFSNEMLAYHGRAGEVIKDFRYPDEQRNLLLPPKTGLRDWRTQMSVEDVTRFEALAGAQLKAFGYERCTQRIPAGIRLGTQRTRAVREGRHLGRAVRRRLVSRN
jgi:hypothetical protein